MHDVEWTRHESEIGPTLDEEFGSMRAKRYRRLRDCEVVNGHIHGNHSPYCPTSVSHGIRFSRI